MKITKEQVLSNLEDVKKYIQEAESEKKKEKVLGIAIKNRLGEIIFQSTKTTFKEAVIEKGDADLRSANLCGADLCGADLRGADLRDANFRSANLCGADLRDADLCGANLRDADLRDANLCGADLRDAELNCAKFYGKGGSVVIKKKDLDGFLGALGFRLED